MANPNNIMQIIIGKINSMFRLILDCRYLVKVKAAVPMDKSIEPLRTAPVIPITTPSSTKMREKFLI
jgi:hypothetical protein